MGLYRKFEKFFLGLINRLWILFISLHERKNIRKKKKLYRQVELTAEQKKQIDDFYIENYGKKVPYHWHRLYQSYTGKFDYRYIPEFIFSTKLEPQRNRRIDVLPFENKNMLSVLFDGISGVRTPETYVMCVDGAYFDGKRNLITREEAIRLLCDFHGGNYEAVIKVTVDSSSGRGVRMLHVSDGKNTADGKTETFDEIFSAFGRNFVVQEKLIPHPAFAALHPASINTLRVVTYAMKDKIETAPIAMRIGRGGNSVDNAHAGGIFIGVSDEGHLLGEAFTEYQLRFTVHPDTGITFEGYELPLIPEIREAAKALHRRVPTLGFVSWDFTVDSEGRIVLIEANLHSQTVWFPQMAHGKAFFGDDTADMLKLARNPEK